MQVEIRQSTGRSATKLQERVEYRLGFALGNFESQISRVTVYFQDENGPKGGDALRCRMVAKIDRLEEIVVEEKDHNLDSLIDKVTDRLGYTVSRKLDRRRDNHVRIPLREVHDQLGLAAG